MTQEKYNKIMKYGWMIVAVCFLGASVSISAQRDYVGSMMFLAMTCFAAFVSKFYDERMQ